MNKLKVVNILLKFGLLGLLIHAVYFSELPQYKNKAIALRVIFYPLAAALTGIIWWIAVRRKREPADYPYFVDISLTFVVAFDLLGNTLALYDKITIWDDMMHLLLSIPWVLVAGYFLKNRGYDKWATAGLVIAYGLASHIIWEALEYLTFVRSNPTESLSAYRDTIGDLLLSLIGTLIGAFIVAQWLSHKRGARSD
jgi:glycopeptide antibiotics resistance protein